MDDLDLLRELIPPAAAPSDDARRKGSARLAQAIADEAQRGASSHPEQTLATGLLRLIRARPRSSAVALATVVAAAATSLFVSAPWQHSPGFLAKAHAALAPPPGTILHLKSEVTTTSTDPACTVTYGPNETWIDQTPPYRFRDISVSPDVPDSSTDVRVLVCAGGGSPTEVGGPLNARVVKFVPPNTLVDVSPVQNLTQAPDPVRELRAAIGAGRAHDEGKTTLDGRTVEQIRIDPPRPPNCPIPCPRRPRYTYVDPDTFHLVEQRSLEDITLDGVHFVRVKFVARYLAYEYLPRTDANLALTDIRAQHPNACIRGLWRSKPAPNTCR